MADDRERSELVKLFRATVSGPLARSSTLWEDGGGSRHELDAMDRAMQGRTGTS